MKLELELTEDEMKILDDYSMRKVWRLEDAGLEDVPCHKLFYYIHNTIRQTLENKDKK